MKKTVSLIAILLIVALSTQTYAQITLKAGLNMANVSSKYGGESDDDSKSKMGFHVGATLDLPLPGPLSLETGALISTKGQKYDEDGYKSSANIMYLDIPIHAKLSFGLGGIKAFAFAGPYIGMGLSGKYKWELDGESGDESLEFGSDEEESDLKRIDYGLDVGAGVQFGKIQVGVTYGLGLSNLTPGGDSDNFSKNRNIMIGIGYKL